MEKVLVTDLQVRGKRVLLRSDLNVPLDGGEVTDEWRIEESLPTIRWLRERGARVLVMSHLGRPKGKRVEELSLRPVAERLSQHLRKEVRLAPDSIGPEVECLLPGLGDGDVLLLENLRFHPGEEANDAGFARALAALGDLYVNDAFGTSHRAHASMVGVPRKLGQGAMGLLLKKEIGYLGKALASPERPFVAVLGGAKVSGKIKVIENLLPRVDTLLIGGGMAYTILRALGREIGESLLEEESLERAQRILGAARSLGEGRLLLPVDIVAADRFADDADAVVVPAAAIPPDRQGLDIGPATAKLFAEKIRAARTVVWNGPMGVFEFPRFAAGTNALAGALAEATRAGATTIVGGGDSAAAVRRVGLAGQVSHVSTGGGASLEFLEGRSFPALEVLTDR